MADHIRTQIRDRVLNAAVLGTLASTGARVYKDRVTPLDDTEMGAGALVVYCGTEDAPAIETLMGSARREVHMMPLHVNAYVKTTGDFAKTLDTIEAEVRVALMADKLLNGLAKDLTAGISEREDEGDGEKPTGCRRMVFFVEYHIKDSAPTAPMA